MPAIVKEIGKDLIYLSLIGTRWPDMILKIADDV
jgi:hypothetical protein